MMDGDVEARKLGEKLLLDVEVEGLSSILSSLRTMEAECEDDGSTIHRSLFGIPELDALLPSSSPTVLELVSPMPTHHPSGAGKTSLLYLIIAYAILPPTFSSIPDLNGHDAAIILVDPLRHFSAPRLASTILHLLTSHLGVPASTLSPDIKASLLSLTQHCLAHVHIFHPSSWTSLLATLRALPSYLFDRTQHKSTHRRIHSLILEDIDAFTWSLRSSTLKPATTSTSSSRSTPTPLSASSFELTTELTSLRDLLSCNVLLTAPSALPSTFRPLLPAAWPRECGVTRLAVRRVEVLRFAPGMGVEQARGEGPQRWDVVRRARFEVWKVGAGPPSEGLGFVFRVGAHGVEVERE